MRRLACIGAVLLATLVAAGLGAFTSPSRGAGSAYLVRAIFDNAAFAVSGEDVRISGAPVGSIDSLSVARGEPKRAAVVIEIDDSRFTPFHANATCAIRPQSLIGEKYVDCEPGTASAPALKRLTSGPGTGQYYLPVSQTSSPVDSDIAQNIYQEPIRERFALILDELGTGLAARGSDLNAVIHRANPALGETDKVVQILAKQNRQLAQLASDSAKVLTPLAKVRSAIGDFVIQANTTSVASAARATDESRSIQLFPPFLRALRPLMVSLGRLAQQGTPVMNSLGQSASALGREFQNLTPFARAARPALIALGKSSAQSEPLLQATLPLAQRLKRLGVQANPASSSLQKLLDSLNTTGAIEQLMSVLFYGTSAGNGFDSSGHYVRAEPLVGGCTAYVKTPVAGCSANFTNGRGGVPAAADTAAASNPVAVEATRTVATHSTDTLRGLLRYLIGGGR
ncbi:MAG TPA: MlaD family protein [Solirubrobacteraceae bacterium]|jgi:ABC-type transporter Mla subunit MlaD|nr:MlaD family protein [Solirubrobacteraceae bacterium]